jgi:hypothetical protein
MGKSIVIFFFYAVNISSNTSSRVSLMKSQYFKQPQYQHGTGHLIYMVRVSCEEPIFQYQHGTGHLIYMVRRSCEELIFQANPVSAWDRAL